jgi:hypothetical protein
VLGLELDWFQRKVLLKLCIRAKVILFVDLKPSSVKVSHGRMLNPRNNKGTLLVVAATHDDAIFGEKSIWVSVLQLVACNHSNRESLVFQVPECVFLLCQEAKHPLELLPADYRVNMVYRN